MTVRTCFIEHGTESSEEEFRYYAIKGGRQSRASTLEHTGEGRMVPCHY